MSLSVAEAFSALSANWTYTVLVPASSALRFHSFVAAWVFQSVHSLPLWENRIFETPLPGAVRGVFGLGRDTICSTDRIPL